MEIFHSNARRWLDGIAIIGAAIMLSGCTKSSRTDSGTLSHPLKEDASVIMKNGRPLAGLEKVEWIGKIAPEAITANSGDIALVAIPVNRKSFHFIVGRIEKAEGETASVTEMIHPQYLTEEQMISDVYSNVPGGLIFPVPKNLKLKKGDWAVGITKDRHLTLGRVSPLANGHYSIRYYDDIPREEKETYIFPLSGEIAPLQPVIAKTKFAGKTRSRIGFLTLQIGEEFLVTSESGSTVAINAQRDLRARADLSPLQIQETPFQIGETVQAYRWSQGFEEAVIEKVIEPNFVYQINRPSGRSRNSNIPHFWLQKKSPA
jgi:hypothetical protein